MWRRNQALGASRSGRRRTRVGLLVLAVVALTLPTAASAIRDAKPPKPLHYKVLVVTAGDKRSALNQAGVKAINEIGKDDGTKADPNAKFNVELAQNANEIKDRFTATKLERYRAVVFLDTAGGEPAHRRAEGCVRGVLPQGRRLRRRSARRSRPSPRWQFLTDILGTRASGSAGVAVGHDQGRRPRPRRDQEPAGVLGPHRRLVQLHGERPRRLARARHRRRGSVRPAAAGQGARRASPAARWAPTTRSPGARTTRAAARSTPALGNTAGELRRRRPHDAPQGRDQLGRRRSRPGLQRLRRDRARELPADQDQRPAEPERADRLRPAPGRAHHPDRPPRRRAPARPRHDDGDRRLRDRSPHDARSTPTARTACTARRVDNNFATNHWVYLYYAPQTVTDIKLLGRDDGSHERLRRPRPRTARRRPRPRRPDRLGLLVGYFQLSRFKFVDDAPGVAGAPGPRPPSSRSCASPTTAASAATSRATSTSTSTTTCGWSRATTRRAARHRRRRLRARASTRRPTSSRRSASTNATGGTFTLTFNGQTTAPIAVQRDRRADRQPRWRRCRNIGADNIQTSGGPVNTANVNVFVRLAGRLRGAERRDAHRRRDRPDRHHADGHDGVGRRRRTDRTEGGWFQRPTGDDRRSALNTNDLRGKVLRIQVKDDDITAGRLQQGRLRLRHGAYTIPSGNLFPLVGGHAAGRRCGPRSTRWASATRSGCRSTRTTSRTSATTRPTRRRRSAVPRAVGRRPLRDRPAPGQLRLAVLLSSRSCRLLPVELPASSMHRHDHQPVPAGRPAAAVRLRQPGTRPEQRLAGTLNGGPGVEPGLRGDARRSPIRTSGTRTATTTRRRRSGTPCFGYYGPTRRAPIAPGSTTECPRLFPELYTGGVGPHGDRRSTTTTRRTRTRRSSRRTTTTRSSWASSRRTRCASSSSTRRTASSRSTTFLDCGAGEHRQPAVRRSSATTRWTCSSAPTATFYLLTYGDGFFNINPDAGLYRWEYVKGQRAPKAVLTTDRTDGAAAADGQLLQRGLAATPDPGDSITLRLGLRRRLARTRPSPNPTHTYTKAGPLHGRPDGHRLVGQDALGRAR